jgi:hypothetical protein
MPLYLYQAAYTPESVAAQIREPADRFAAQNHYSARRSARFPTLELCARSAAISALSMDQRRSLSAPRSWFPCGVGSIRRG